MLNSGKTLILILSISLLIVFLVYHYVFNIYETTVQVEPENLFAGSKSTIRITVLPINALGFKVPFRNIYSKFDITEGKELVNIVKEDNQNGSLSLKAKNGTGKVVVIIHSGYSLLPSLVEINIYPNAA